MLRRLAWRGPARRDGTLTGAGMRCSAWGRWGVRLICGLALVCSFAISLPAVAAPADSPTASSVTLTLPRFTPPLQGTEQFQATATAPNGETVVSVVFQYKPAGASQDQWTSFPDGPQAAPPGASVYAASDTLDTTTLGDDGFGAGSGIGVYDFRAVATYSAGDTDASATAPDVAVANNATYVPLANTGSPLSDLASGQNVSITLTATPQAGGFFPDTVTFEYCLTADDCSNSGNWQSIGDPVPPQTDDNGNPTGSFVTTFDPTSLHLADGSYDLSVSATDAISNPTSPDIFVGGVVGDVLIDDTPPNVILNPAGSLSGSDATLTATATDPGSGVADVQFQVAPAGTGNWTTVGVASGPTTAGGSTYSTTFDARQLSDGSYDVQAVAADEAGNTASSTLTGVPVSNPGAQPFPGLTITDYAAPASRVQLLGELPGGQHETWAIGQTNAPPPTVNGAPLPYTAQGNGQIVLLQYTDATGWQIVDVLRCGAAATSGPCQGLSQGSAFPLVGGAAVVYAGAMTASGEAWITLQENYLVGRNQAHTYAVFHRPAGGPFEYDQAATSALTTPTNLLTGTPTIRLGETASGAAYGMLFVPSPPSTNQTEPSPNGPVSVTTALEFGQLVEPASGCDAGANSPPCWTVQGSSLPAGWVAPFGVTEVQLKAADVTGPGTGWAALEQDGGGVGHPMILARFDANGWTFLSQTGLDALDLTGAFAPDSPQSLAAGAVSTLTPSALKADGDGVWIKATFANGGAIIARTDASGKVVQSWCVGLPRESLGCGRQLDVDHPAAVPDAVFPNSDVEGEALVGGALDVYYDGAWTSVGATGLGPSLEASTFADPTDGWLAGVNTLARVSSSPLPGQLSSWPEANKNPLLSVALPPGQTTTDTPGALAVGLNGTALHYDASAGWQVDPTPPQTHHIELTRVAFASPSLAFAVGQEGTILRWDGTSWTEDPQSVQVTTSTLNAVAFAPDGEGWAVGGFGTVLHYNGNAWSPEQIDSQDVGANITSVAVAGQYVYAIAAGNLVVRCPDGTWQPVPAATSSSPACGSITLPSPTPPTGSLELVSGLPDGGVAVAGKSLLMVRQNASTKLTYSPQSFSGIPVALAAFRDPSRGNVRAFVSVAPPIDTIAGSTDVLGGFPAGDGDLLLQTNSGWQDLGQALPAGSTYAAVGDGVVQPDPVLGVAASPDGGHAWVVGGYAGTHAADGIGTDQLLNARSTDWLTSAIWRYDAGGSASSPQTTQSTVSLPSSPSTVSFAFFSSPMCKVECAAVQHAQPQVNLSAAASQIASFAQQPGGPAFAVLGGNAVGPIENDAYEQGFGGVDLAHIPALLSPLSRALPTYAAFGPLDSVPTNADPGLPWAQAFANSPAPFGQGATPSGITPQGSGDSDGPVSRYYAFDVTQNGATLRAIVLDNSAGSLEASAPGQTAWLSGQLAQAQSEGVPVVVFAAEPLNVNDLGAANDADAVASQLAAAGVLAVFTTSGGAGLSFATQQDQVAEVPADAPIGAPQVPEYEGATLTYQQPKNNGVLWYDVSVNTSTNKVSVQGIPVISSLAMEPLDGLSVARSSTLQFQAIARRPTATIATTPADPTFPGYGQYVDIPASTCSGCIGPSYSFTSSNPIVGNFVAPSGPGSPFPKLSATGATTPSSSSGLFCAFNGGTTTVSVTSGVLTSSLTVTVAPGGYGPPCGTVAGGTSTSVITLGGKTIVEAGSNPGVGNLGAPLTSTPTASLPKITVPLLPLASVPTPLPPKPKPITPGPPISVPLLQASPTFAPVPPLGLPPIALPLIPPALTPVPPGGATVSAQATARREEKARRHASQSAYVIRPAGTSATDWFFPVVATVSVLALLLLGGGLRSRQRYQLAFAEQRDADRRQRRTQL